MNDQRATAQKIITAMKAKGVLEEFQQRLREMPLPDAEKILLGWWEKNGG